MLAVIDIIIYLAASVLVDTQNEPTTKTCDKWEIQNARYAIWAGFGISVITSFIVFGITYPNSKIPMI